MSQTNIYQCDLCEATFPSSYSKYRCSECGSMIERIAEPVEIQVGDQVMTLRPPNSSDPRGTIEACEFSIGVSTTEDHLRERGKQPDYREEKIREHRLRMHREAVTSKRFSIVWGGYMRWIPTWPKIWPWRKVYVWRITRNEMPP